MIKNQPGIIDIEDLSVSYGNKRVLSHIYLHVEPGNIYGVVGPNGAGKSTLFKAILGLIKPDSGTISYSGGLLRDVQRKIVYVPQRDNVDWTFPATVYDIVMMGRYPHKSFFSIINSEDEAIAHEAMQAIDIEWLKDRQIGELSGGQQQRVFIARALAQRAEIFLLDEPFVGVDITTEEKIIDLLKELADEGKTLMVVHHDLATVEQYFNKVVLINQRLIAAGDTAVVFNNENVAKTFSGQLTILHKATGGV